MSSMMSQLILNLDTSDNGVYYNGESVCIALCNIAKLHAENVSMHVCVYLTNKFNFWNVHGIMNTSSFLQSK